MARRMIIILVVAILLVIAGVTGYLVYKDHNKGKSTANTTTASSSNSASQNNQTAPVIDQTQDQPAKTYPMVVYFSKKPESDVDPSKVFAINRIAPDLGVAKFAITELLKGPTVAEAAQGYFITVKLRTGASNCGGEDFELNIESGTAKLQFCRQLDHVGSVSDGQAEAEIKATLKQFTSVTKVVILSSQGTCEFDLSGLNLCLN